MKKYIYRVGYHDGRSTKQKLVIELETENYDEALEMARYLHYNGVLKPVFEVRSERKWREVNFDY